MKEVVPKNRTIVSLTQRGGAVSASPTKGGPKWRDNYPEGSDYLVAPNRLSRSSYKATNKQQLDCMTCVKLDCFLFLVFAEIATLSW